MFSVTCFLFLPFSSLHRPPPLRRWDEEVEHGTVVQRCVRCVCVCVCVCVCACVGGWVDGAQWTLVPGRRRLVEDDARRRNVPQAVAHFFLFRPPLAPARIAILVSFHTDHTHTHTHLLKWEPAARK